MRCIGAGQSTRASLEWKRHRNLRNSVLVYFSYQTTFTNNENEVWLYKVDVFDRTSCMWLDGHISTRCLKFDIFTSTDALIILQFKKHTSKDVVRLCIKTIFHKK